MQWLHYIVLAVALLLFWRDIHAAVKARLLRLVADVRSLGAGSRGFVSSATRNWVAALCVGIVIGTFAPAGIKWVREQGWQIPWPDIPVIVVPAEGKRRAYIVRESETDTLEFGILANQLRNGDSAKYIASKGHTLTIHDDDDVDAAGQPVAILAANKPFVGVELLIFDTGKLLKREPCPATASSVIEAIKRSGG